MRTLLAPFIVVYLGYLAVRCALYAEDNAGYADSAYGAIGFIVCSIALMFSLGGLTPWWDAIIEILNKKFYKDVYYDKEKRKER